MTDTNDDNGLDKTINEWTADEARVMEESITDWSDLSQLIAAMKTLRFSLPLKLKEAFKQLGEAAILALIQAFDDPDSREPSFAITSCLLHFGEGVYPFLQNALADPNEQIRCHVAKTITKFEGDEVNELFITLTKNENDDIRRTAADYLKEYAEPSMRGLFIDLLEHDDATRRCAAGGLAKLGDSISINALIKVILNADIETLERRPLIDILVASGTERCKETLKQLLADPVENIRAKAIEELGSMGATEMVDTLIAILYEDPPSWVRWVAVDALGALGDPKAVDHLLKIVDRHNDQDISETCYDRSAWYGACQALGDFQDERAIMPLLRCVHDQDKYESRVALHALEKFGERALLPVISELNTTTDELMIRNCVDTLGALKDISGLAPVLERVDCENDYTRQKVYWAVEEMCAANGCLPLKPYLLSFLQDSRVEEWARKYITKTCGEEVLAQFFDDMKEEEEKAHDTVAALFETADDPAGEFIRLLQDESRLIRREAAIRLGLVHDVEVVDSLLAALHDSASDVVAAAVFSLGMLHDERAIDPLAAILNKRRETTQKCIISALGEIGTDRAIQVLIAAYSITGLNGSVDSEILKLGERAVPYLLKAMEDPNYRFYLASLIYIVGELKAASAAERLMIMLNSKGYSLLHCYIEKALLKMGIEPVKGLVVSGETSENEDGLHVLATMSFDTFMKMNG